MSWFDEHLFGWSRNSKHGTSAWSSFSGDESSRLATPDETDEEDIGDYDNVVGIVTSTEDTRLQSHRSSYADLQKLKCIPPPVIAGQGASGNAPKTTPESIDNHKKRKLLNYDAWQSYSSWLPADMQLKICIWRYIHIAGIV